jgi:signal transduction histidine kinase
MNGLNPTLGVDTERTAPKPATPVKNFADALPHAVLVMDPHGLLVHANRVWFASTALDEQKTYGLDGWLAAFDPADAPAVASAWARLLSEGHPFDVQARLKHAGDGTNKWVLGRANAVRDDRGDISRWIVTFTDIDSLRRTHETTNRELDDFCYSVSHDLRTPLRAIDGFTKTLLDEDGDLLSENGRGSLGRIRAAASRMDGLITSLLTLARVSRSEVVPVSVDLSLRFRRLAEHARHQDVEFAVTDDLRATCDSRLIDLLLTNLIENAIKFSAEAGTTKIEFGRAVSGDGTTAFFVRDNGVGFDSRYGSRLFKPFERLHGSSYPGHGIGLAIVQKIVAKHGGHVWADGAEGAGATFWFVLPN